MNTKEQEVITKKQFPVTGMSCASCAASVENTLSAQQGILHANVSFANNSAQIEYTPAVTSPRQMKAALQQAGYDIIVDETEKPKEEFEQAKKNNFTTPPNINITPTPLPPPLCPHS